MTEQEAIELLDSFYEMDEMHDAAQIAIKALEEIQQYRAIGTVEELKESKEQYDIINCAAKSIQLSGLCDFENAKGKIISEIKRNYEYSLKDYESIGTPDECRAAAEKQKAKKPKEYEDKFYGCPVCGNVLLHKWEKYPTKLIDKKNGLPYCLGCGQKLDWSDEE